MLGVFTKRIFKVNLIDIGQGAQPRENIGKLFFFVCQIVSGQSRRQFADFLDEPKKSGRRTPLAIPPAVMGFDSLLELAYVHLGASKTTAKSVNQLAETGLVVNIANFLGGLGADIFHFDGKGLLAGLFGQMEMTHQRAINGLDDLQHGDPFGRTG